MAKKPTYRELLQRVHELEDEKHLLEKSNKYKPKLHNKNIQNQKTESEINFRTDTTNLNLAAIININEIQSIMDDFYHLTNMVTAILDLEGNIIEKTGWQDICSMFHRTHPETASNCTKSDLFLTKNLKPGEYSSYKCKNGLWDIVTPLYVNNTHLGNIYTGQFFYDNEDIDEKFFIKQAEKYGFDKVPYLDALHRVPRYSRETVDHLMQFLVKFTAYISKISLFNIQLEKEIHERKKIETTLKSREAHLQTLIRTIPDLIWLKDEHGVYQLCNSIFERFFNAKEKEIIGKTDYDFVNKELADFFRSFDEKAMTMGETIKFEEEITFADNGYRAILETTKTPIYREDGEIIGVLGIGHDITERKQAEKEKEQMMSAIEQSSESIVITDKDGIILYINPSFEKGTGYTNKEIIGKNPRLLKSGKHDKKFYSDMWGTISSGKNWHGRFINKRKDGNFITEEVSISPVVDKSGNIINYVSVRRDITEYLNMEQEKTRLEEQYAQAQKVESIGRLAGGVAHDLNNLLSPILGYSELLLDDLKSDESSIKQIEQIIRAGLAAKDLVHQLLAFSRKQTLEYLPINLNDAVKGFEKLIRRTIREDIDIKTILYPDILTVMADIGQIEQVIMNLAVNAADAMPNGGRLTIETTLSELDENDLKVEQLAQPGKYAVLAVSDTGSGMDQAVLNHLFEPFYSTKGEHGTGLGLATVYGIIKQHGGNIWVYSEQGKGTIFKIYLPLFTIISTINKKRKQKRISSDLKGTETILLVEDNDQVRNIVTDILTRYGYKLIIAKSGIEVLKLIESYKNVIHLMLSDVIMPGMNGKELYSNVVKKQKGIKVLYMSGYTDNIIAYHGILDKDVQFIQKPFTVDGLMSKIREVLKKE